MKPIKHQEAHVTTAAPTIAHRPAAVQTPADSPVATPRPGPIVIRCLTPTCSGTQDIWHTRQAGANTVRSVRCLRCGRLHKRTDPRDVQVVPFRPPAPAVAK